MNKQGVYILKCINNRYYIGSTDNLDRRLTEHQKGKVKSTKNIIPVCLVFFEECSTLTQVRKLEYKLKSKKSKAIVENIIKDGYIKFN